MAPKTVHIAGKVKKVGNSLAIFIPASDAKKAGIKEGDRVDAAITADLPHPLGLLKHIPYEPFDRRKEGMWRDRI